MKKKGLILLSGIMLLGALSAGGCEKKEAADDYLGRYITRAKESEGELESVLEDGIVQVKEDEEYVIDFPEELKKPYEAFLQEALKQVQFELNKADKESEDTYLVRVTYEPLDIASVTQAINEEYAKNIASTDLTTEAKVLIEKDIELLASADKQQKKSQTIQVKKSGDTFEIEEEDVKELLKSALPGYMAPYTAVAGVFDMRDFIQAYLDASFKGETERYQLHTGQTAEEAAAGYEESFSEFRLDELSDEQNDRLMNAMKAIFKNCQYSVGITKMNTLTEYVFDMTTKPNTSILNAVDELNAGVYYSQEAVNEACLEIYEKYAAQPTYDEEKTITVTWNAFKMLSDQLDDAEYNNMLNAIIPTE
ncbi:MAG: hypothetical protein HFH11_07885 [Dorea sp.]|jgi:hypothetical protein|nr:hypothetical protein [Dorea sp.]